LKPLPKKPPIDQQLILTSLSALAKELGRPPSRSEFISASKISEHKISQFFPTWGDAVRAAGFHPYIVNARLNDRALLRDWANVVRAIRKIPARRSYRHLGQFDPRTFERRFGPWSKLPEVFRKFAQDKPEWADVVALLPVPKPANPAPGAQGFSPEAFLVSEGDRASSRALRSRNTNHEPRPPRHAPLPGRPTYGNPMDFRGLRHEPVNEQGVVLLFALVAKELGYIVEAVQSGFPDCEAKRQVAPQRWQRVHLEFEFESRNFRDHGHPTTGCDLIVCWRHNWPDAPPHLEILELSTLIRCLSPTED